MGITIIQVTDAKAKSRYTEKILRSLPGWFGIEESIRDYIAGVEKLPFWAALDGDSCVGFVAGKIHHGHTGDIYVIGIAREYHRRGIGGKLVCATEKYFCEQGCIYMIVKTLDESANYEPYDRTRKFYRAVGFEPLITLNELWDERNPCLIMLKRLTN